MLTAAGPVRSLDMASQPWLRADAAEVPHEVGFACRVTGVNYSVLCGTGPLFVQESAILADQFVVDKHLAALA